MGDYAGNFFRQQAKYALATRFFFRHGLAMKTAPEIIDFIGQDKIIAAMHVQADAVRKARAAGVLPASWYHTLEKLAGRPLPRDVFSFKGDAA